MKFVQIIDFVTECIEETRELAELCTRPPSLTDCDVREMTELKSWLDPGPRVTGMRGLNPPERITACSFDSGHS
jgi:hypothetical protein